MLEALVGPFDGDVDDAVARASALHPASRTSCRHSLGITIAPTRLRGSSARNVMPGRATSNATAVSFPV